MPKTILITGGAGFIGSHVVDQLIKSGERVIVLDNFNDYYSPQIKRHNIAHHQQQARFKLVEGDILNESLLNQLFKESSIDTVIHLAARAGVRPSLEQPQLYFQVNVLGTLNLLEVMKRYQVGNLVFASSSSVYGNHASGPFTEDLTTDTPVSPYGASKKAGEVLCSSYAHLYQISVKCLRFFTAYGPRNRPDMACFKFTRAIASGMPITQYGDGTTGRDYTYIKDIVAGIVAASQLQTPFEIINLGNSSPISLRKLITTIEKVVNKKAVLYKEPIQPGDVELTFADITKARKLLQFKPTTSIDTGLAYLYHWYQYNHQLFD